VTDLFPIIQPEVVQEETELPLYREVKWDFEKGEPVFRGGEPVVAEGAEAIKTWVWKALVTERARYEIYSWNFGSEVESLIGQPYTDELKRAEAVRYVREALEINPYITEVTAASVDFDNGVLTIDVTVDTVYGEVQAHV
jgi:phage protein